MKAVQSAILFIVAVSAGVFSQTSFGILPVKRVDATPAQAEEVLNAAYQYFIEAGKYRIVDRQQLEKVMGEQSLQLSGAVDSTKMTAVGKILGIEKLVATTVSPAANRNFRVKMSVIDVATSQVELSKERTGENGVSANTVTKWCVGRILNEYPLLGRITGKSKDIYVVNLGKANRVTPGDRLFVARKTQLIGDDGRVLMSEMKRIGTLMIDKVTETVSQAHALGTESAEPVATDDIVSPEPVPKKDTKPAYAPALPFVKNGRLLLEDDMSRNTYLSIINNDGPSYSNGRLDLNAIGLTAGNLEAFCSYPPAMFGQLENFVMEGEFEFQPVKDDWNRLYIKFRQSGDHATENCYSFFINQKGYFEFYRFMFGSYITIVPNQHTAAFYEGGKVNKFRIVALGPQFDVYLNDQLLVSVEDEYFQKGSIGFQVRKGGRVKIDNIKVWEAVDGRK